MVKVLIENIELAGRTLTVPQEVSEDGKLILDEKGQALLSQKAAASLCSVPGFKAIGEKTIKDDEPTKEEELKVKHDDANLDKQPITPEKLETEDLTFEAEKEEELSVDKAAASQNLEPSPDWKKEELAAWLADRGIEFKAKDGKEVLLGKAFKYLENQKPNE